MVRITSIGIALFVLLSMSSCWQANVIGGPIDESRLKDGIYQGESSKGPNSVRVEVEIINHKIQKVNVLKNTGWKSPRAVPVIPNRIVEEQSTKVDAVSGATNSSNVIMNAVQDALEKAMRAGE